MPLKPWLRKTTIMAAIVGACTIPITTTKAATDISLTTISEGNPATSATMIVVTMGSAKAITK